MIGNDSRIVVNLRTLMPNFVHALVLLVRDVCICWMQVAFWVAPPKWVPVPIAAPTCVRESRGELRGWVGNLAALNSASLGTTIRTTG